MIIESINLFRCLKLKSGLTRLELASSAVTGRCSNQLNYNPRIMDYIVCRYFNYFFLFVNFLFFSVLLILIKEKQGFEPWVQIIVR